MFNNKPTFFPYLFSLIKLTIITALISGCSTQQKQYNPKSYYFDTTPQNSNKNSVTKIIDDPIKHFQDACLKTFIESGSAEKYATKNNLKLLSPDKTREYTGKEIGFAYSDGVYVISTTKNTCSVFIKYANKNELIKKFTENIISKIQKNKYSIIVNSKIKSSYESTQLEFTNKSGINQKVAILVAENTSQALLASFTNRLKNLQTTTDYSPLTLLPETAQAILTMSLQPNKNQTNITQAKIKSQERSEECSILFTLFKNCIYESKKSTWSLPKEFFSSPININEKNKPYWGNNNENVETSIIKLIRLNNDSVLAIFQSIPIGGMYSCHGCTPLIGAAILKESKKTWRKIYENKFLAFAGGYGEIKPSTIRLIDQSGIFSINNHYIGQGHHTYSSIIISPDGNSFNIIWRDVTGRSNEGDCEAPNYGSMSKCRSFKYNISFSKDTSNGKPDMLLNAKVKGTPVSSEYKGSFLLYKFDGNAYKLAQ